MPAAQQNATPKKAPRWAAAFLAALGKTGNVRLSAAAAEVHRATAYRLRAADPAFASGWAAAEEEAGDRLEEEARRRAVDGLRRVKFHQGSPIMVPLLRDGQPVVQPVLGADGRPVDPPRTEPVLVPYAEHEYSDTLLIFLLKGARPEKYRERQESTVKFDGELVVKKIGGGASLGDL